MDKQFKNKVVLVTGATGRIGFTIAQKFSSSGAIVGVGGRSQDKVQNVIRYIIQNGGKAFPLVGDLQEERNVSFILEESLSKGKVTAFIHCAAIRPRIEYDSISSESWDAVNNVNLKSAFFLTQGILNDTKKGNEPCAITYMSSMVVDHVPNYYTGAHYIASKSGLEALAKGLSAEAASCGVRINALRLGLVETPELTTEGREYSKTHSAFHKPLELNKIAETVLFLSSANALGITGECISLGGF